MSTIKVVGMDPSLQNWGVAKATLDMNTMTFVVDELILTSTSPDKKNKVIRKNCEDLTRAQVLQQAMQQGAKDAVMAFVEIPVGSQSARAMASYGVCIGVLSALDIPMIPVTPTEVKKAATGYKNATKEEMIEWALAKYPAAKWLRHGGKLTNANEHLADAVAAIEAGIDTEEFSRLVSVLKGAGFKSLSSA